MKIKPRVGVDIDEVLVNQLEQAIAFYKLKTGKYIPLENFFSYNWWEVRGISKEESLKIDREFRFSTYFNKLSLVKGAKNAILKLSFSYEIIFITSRPFLIKKKTEDFIKKTFPDKQFKILFSNDFHIENSGKTKSEIAKELDLDFLIEDSFEYSAQSAEKGIKVFFLNKPWNKGATHKNIIQIKSWEDIFKKIK